MENKQSNELEPKVTGVGGIFFFSENPEKTKEWYNKNLGLPTDQWGTTFESRNLNKPEQIEFMINYRVQNIEGLLKKLKENGVTILDEVATYEYGKFVHIMDDEGNKIELWEPVEDYKF